MTTETETTTDERSSERLLLPASLNGAAPALITETGETISYHELDDLLGQARRLLDWSEKALVSVFCDRDLGGIIAYLACLSAGHACAFFGALPAAAQESLVATYQPEFIIGSPVDDGALRHGYAVAGTLPGGSVVQHRIAGPAGPIAPHLALLLTTSGSTGSPVLVRLSYRNLAANSSAIVEALGIESSDRAVTSLPLSHCYGLSVLNTHLTSGAAVVICAHGVLGRRFWRFAAQHDVTTFAGVPLIYETLRDRGFSLERVPALNTLQCSGGAIRQQVVRYFAEEAGGRKPRFWVMYGQTEATARIACLPPEEWAERAGSAGRVVPGGQLRIVADDGSVLPDGSVGMVSYSGPSVMLGYARTRSDLNLPDVMGGSLPTEDLGYITDGYLYLTGRLKRIVKVLGLRIELDEIERAFADLGGAVAVAGAGDTVAVLVRKQQRGHEQVRQGLLRMLRLPPAALIVSEIGDVPLTRSGKPDYPALSSLALSVSRSRLPSAAAGPGKPHHPRGLQ